MLRNVPDQGLSSDNKNDNINVYIYLDVELKGTTMVTYK